MDGDPIEELEDRLARQPADRYPIQHATTLFHLGTLRLRRGELDLAIDSFADAIRLFEPLPPERARCVNMSGIALRDARRLDEAADAFQEAARLFRDAELVSEAAAAEFNRGLVLAEAGHPAAGSFRAARDAFRAASAPRQAAAAARELGQALLVEGRAGDAVHVLEEAIETSTAVGDEAGRGAAANALGLALLALDDHVGAIEAFRTARASHPRSVRPDQHAMASANVALAFERAGDLARAQVAAQQAQAIPEADTPVIEQCRAILARLGDDADAFFIVLADEPVDRWPALFRDDLHRWTDVGADDRAAAARRLAEELVRPGADDVAAAWLGAALELPPAGLDVVVSAVVSSASTLVAEHTARVRACISRASARFHVPQMHRLEALLDRADRAAGEPAP